MLGRASSGRQSCVYDAGNRNVPGDPHVSMTGVTFCHGNVALQRYSAEDAGDLAAAAQAALEEAFPGDAAGANADAEPVQLQLNSQLKKRALLSDAYAVRKRMRAEQ